MGLGQLNYSAFRAPQANVHSKNVKMSSQSSDEDSSSSEDISDSSESSVDMDLEEFKNDRPMP